MKKLRFIITSLALLFATQSVSIAQTTDITETFKKHFNETVENVKKTESADKKRELLNESFSKMISTLDRVESRANLNEEEAKMLNSYRSDISEKQQELNGLNGFDAVQDATLDDFSDYSQDFIEQADRTVTIGVTTVLLILIILLLL